jgi:hypothetical protein
MEKVRGSKTETNTHPTFRIQSKDIAVTYPKCPLTPLELKVHLQAVWFSIKYVCVSQETHEDGVPHLHAQIQFEKKCDIRNARILDFQGYHPNIQPTNHSTQWNDYVKKEGNWLEEGEFKATNNGHGRKKTNLDNATLLNSNVKSLIDSDQVTLYSLGTLLRARQLYKDLCPETLPTCTQKLPDNWVGITLDLHPVSIKKRHFWIYSIQPDQGKSTFLEKLNSSFRCSYYTQSEKYQVIKQDSQFVLFDEFAKGNSVRITDLNLMCDGSYKYPCKGKESVLLEKPYIVLCSNFPIDAVYPNSNGRIESRFNQIVLDGCGYV